MSNAFSISFRLHDIDTNAHDFYNWAKKEEENSTIKFYFCQLMIMKDRSPSYQKHANCGRGTLLVFVKIILDIFQA